MTCRYIQYICLYRYDYFTWLNTCSFGITVTHKIITNFDSGNFIDKFILVHFIFGANDKVMIIPPSKNIINVCLILWMFFNSLHFWTRPTSNGCPVGITALVYTCAIDLVHDMLMVHDVWSFNIFVYFWIIIFICVLHITYLHKK